jgi:hypothetical protein
MQLRALSSVAKADEVETSTWDQLRNLENDAEGVIRISGLPATFREVSASMLSDDFPWISGYIDPVRGVLRLILREPPDAAASEEPPDAAASEDSLLGIDPSDQQEHIVFEQLPGEAWGYIPSSVSDSLSRGIKKAYDPNNILNPGILGD